MVISTKNMAKRILIADDSVTIQKAFAMTFAGADDVTLTSARSADEALAIAQRLQPDLVVADGVMPGRSGYDLCAAIRADAGLRAVPVFILASSQQPYDEARGQRAGASGQLMKPWDTAVLLEKVREVLRGSAGALAAPTHPPAPVRAAPSTSTPDDDEYGEISIEGRNSEQQRSRMITPPPGQARARLVTPPPPSANPGIGSAPLSHPAAVPLAPGSGPAMRPSLIPGMRPGAVPPARPGTVPVRPTGAGMPGVGAAPAGIAAPTGRASGWTYDDWTPGGQPSHAGGDASELASAGLANAQPARRCPVWRLDRRPRRRGPPRCRRSLRCDRR